MCVGGCVHMPHDVLCILQVLMCNVYIIIVVSIKNVPCLDVRLDEMARHHFYLLSVGLESAKTVTQPQPFWACSWKGRLYG